MRRAQEIIASDRGPGYHPASALRGPASVEAEALEAVRDEAFEAFADTPDKSDAAVDRSTTLATDLMRELSGQLRALDQQRSHLADLLERARQDGDSSR